MAIIVEDGTEVTGANSYLTLSEARLILADYGQDLDINDETASIQLLFGAKYVESFRGQMLGNKNTQSQPMQFPRSNVYLDGWLLPNDEIPQALKNAQAFAAYEKKEGNILQGTTRNQSIAEERVEGSITVKYFNTGAIDERPTLVRVQDELGMLLKTSWGTYIGERG